MHDCLKKINFIESKIGEIINNNQLRNIPQIIAVSKTFSINNITPLLEKGHIHFGENKIQEAENKWVNLKEKYPHFKLHMIGSLQSNKAKKAVKLFDYIHSLGTEKLALKISQYEKELNKKVKIFIQVNISNENQRAGILLKNLNNFYNYCSFDLSLNIIGLMCLPPIDENPAKAFEIVMKKSKELNLLDLSIGMSNDYETAILYESTYLRLGTAIFGKREVK
jgi:pyridoxal phosphate enzyme (YggS family)